MAGDTGAASCRDLQAFAAVGTGGRQSGGQCVSVFGRQGQADC